MKNIYILKDEKGQNLIEFALIFPLLILLTLGGIYLSISFVQKSVMNGMTFMAARAASVRGNPTEAVKIIENKYKNDFKQNWIKEVKTNVKILTKDKVTVQTSKKGNVWDLLAATFSIITGGSQFKNKEIVCTNTITREYFTSSLTGSSRPQTDTTVNYKYTIMGDSELGSYVENIINICPKFVLNTKQMVDEQSEKQSKDQIIGTRPLNINISDICQNKGGIFPPGTRLKLVSGSLENEPRKFSETPGGMFKKMKELAGTMDTLENYSLVTSLITEFSGYGSYFGVIAEDASKIGEGIEKISIPFIKLLEDHLKTTFDNVPTGETK